MRTIKKRSGSLLFPLAALAVGFTASNSFANFTLFDNFDGYTAGANLAGQGPAGNLWTLTPMGGASATGMVTRADSGGLATFVGPTGVSASYRALGPSGLSIGNGSTAATVFWQFRVNQSSGNNWNFVLTDVNPTDTAGSSEVQFNFDSTALGAGGVTTFRARNGGAFKGLSTTGAGTGGCDGDVGLTPPCCLIKRSLKLSPGHLEKWPGILLAAGTGAAAAGAADAAGITGAGIVPGGTAAGASARIEARGKTNKKQHSHLPTFGRDIGGSMGC